MLPAQRGQAVQQGSALATAAEDPKLPRPFVTENKPPSTTATQTDRLASQGSAPGTAFPSLGQRAGSFALDQ